MTKILFICWGNICRSPAAALLFTEMARHGGLEDEFFAASAGVSDEEEGHDVYPPMRRLLEERGIDCSAHRARKLRPGDAEEYDLLICMDEITIGRTRRLIGPLGGDEKIRNLLDYAGRKGEEIDDPWYTREFERALGEIEEGCRGLFEALTGPVTLDLSRCAARGEIYAELREKMRWQSWYGSNLDALWDILTGLEYEGRSFRILMPPEDSPFASYAKLVRETFREAGKLKE